MEFLDSLDLVTPNKKSKRMRSWYLYEQYKSLEKSQLDAAQKLKDRSYQDKILYQELSERRARRRLYDQIGICQSECDVQRVFKNDGTTTDFSVSTNDYFETFCEFQHDDNLIKETEHDGADTEDLLSQDGSQLHSHYIEDFKNIEAMDEEEDSKPNSVLGIDDNTIPYENLPDDDIKDELEMAKKNIAENINFQLETVKENIECLEKYTKLYADGNIFLDESELSDKAIKVDTKNMKKDNSLFTFWTKLVSFAYQVIQLNHGNCYDDYSLQLFTAVLACDILRRGVSRMCRILQPYVSPINYISDDDDSSASHINVTRKNIYDRKKSTQNSGWKQYQTKTQSKKRNMRNLDLWEPGKYEFENRINEKKSRRASEPWRSVAKFSTSVGESKLSTHNNQASFTSSSSSSTIWPEEYSNHLCKCCCQEQLLDPMMKLLNYFELMLNSKTRK